MNNFFILVISISIHLPFHDSASRSTNKPNITHFNLLASHFFYYRIIVTMTEYKITGAAQPGVPS